MRSLLLAFLVGLAVASNALIESSYRARNEYRYKYETQIITGLTHNSLQRTGYKMSCTARIQFTSKSSVTCQFENIVLYKIDQPVVQMAADTNSLPNENIKEWDDPEVRQIIGYLKQPFGLKYTKGHVASVALKDEPVWSSNVKKGFMALFEVNMEKRLMLEDDETPESSPNSLAKIYTVFEKSPTGDCATTYTVRPVVSENPEKELSFVSVRKVRDYSRCLEEPTHLSSPFSGVRLGGQFKTSPVSRQASIEYMIKGEEDSFIIMSAVSQERVVFSPYVDPSSPEEIRTSVNQTLTFVSSKTMQDSTLIRRPRISRSQWQGLRLSLPSHPSIRQDPFSPSQKQQKQPTIWNPMYAYTAEKVAEHFRMVAVNNEFLTSKESLVHLRIATDMLRTLKDFQIDAVWKLLQQTPGHQSINFNSQAAEIFWNTLAVVGTDDAANVILDICLEKNPLMKENCSFALGVMTLTVTPTPEMIQKVIKMINNVNEKSHFLRQKLYLTLGSFAFKLVETRDRYLSQLDTADSILKNLARDNAKYFRKFVKQQVQSVERRRKNIDVVSTEIINTVVEVLEPLAQGNKGIDDQVLGLKAIGNSGLPQFVPVLQGVLANPETTLYVKIMTLEAFRRLACHHSVTPKTIILEVQSALLNVFMNTSESTTVRLTAFKNLMYQKPELPILEEVAGRMRTEPDVLVSNFVVSFFQAFANTTYTPLYDVSQNYSIALKAAPERTLRKSLYSLKGDYNEQVRMGLSVAVEQVEALDNVIGYHLHVSNVIYGLFSDTFEMGFTASGLKELLRSLIKSKESDKAPSTSKLLMNILKELNIKSATSQPPIGDAYIRVMGNELFYMDRRSLAESFVSQGFSQGMLSSERQDEFKLPINLRMAMLMLDVKLSLPTEAGFPVGVQAQLSAALKADGHVKLSISPEILKGVGNANLTVHVGSKLVLGMYASMGLDDFFLKPTAGFYGLLKCEAPMKKEVTMHVDPDNFQMVTDAKVEHLKEMPLVETIVEPMTEFVFIPVSVTTPVVKINVQPIYASQDVRTVPINNVVPLTWLGWKLQVTGQRPVPSACEIKCPHPLKGRSLMNLWFQPLDTSAPESLTVTVIYSKNSTMPSHSSPTQSPVSEWVQQQVPQMSVMKHDRKFILHVLGKSATAGNRQFGTAAVWQSTKVGQTSPGPVEAFVFRSAIPGVSDKPWTLEAKLLLHYPWKHHQTEDVYSIEWQKELMDEMAVQVTSDANHKVNQFLNMTINGMEQQLNYQAMRKVPAYRLLDGLIPQHMITVMNSEVSIPDREDWQYWWTKLMPLYDSAMEEKRALISREMPNRDTYMLDSLQDLHETQLALMGDLEKIENGGEFLHAELPIMTWVVMRQADIVMTFRELAYRYDGTGQITHKSQIVDRIQEDSHMSKRLLEQALNIMKHMPMINGETKPTLPNMSTPPPQLLEGLAQLYIRQTEQAIAVTHTIDSNEDVKVGEILNLINQTHDTLTSFDMYFKDNAILNVTVVESLMTVAVQNELLIHLWQSYWAVKDFLGEENNQRLEEIQCDKHLKMISYDLAPRVCGLHSTYLMDSIFVNKQWENQLPILANINAAQRGILVDQRTFEMKLFSNDTALQNRIRTTELLTDLMSKVKHYAEQIKAVIKDMSTLKTPPHVYVTGQVLGATQQLKSYVEETRQVMVQLSYPARLPFINDLDKAETSVQSIIASMSTIFEKYNVPSTLQQPIPIPDSLSVYTQLMNVESVLIQQDQIIRQLSRFVKSRNVEPEVLQKVLADVLNEAEHLQQSLQQQAQQAEASEQQQRRPIIDAIVEAVKQQRQIFNIVKSVLRTRASSLQDVPQMQQQLATLEKKLSALVAQVPSDRSSVSMIPSNYGLGVLNITWGEGRVVEGRFQLKMRISRTVEQIYYIFNQLKGIVRSQELVDAVNYKLTGMVWGADESFQNTLNTYGKVHVQAVYNPAQMPTWFNTYFTSTQETLKNNMWHFYNRQGPIVPSYMERDVQFQSFLQISQLNKKFEMALLTREESDLFVNVPLSPLVDVLKPLSFLRPAPYLPPVYVSATSNPDLSQAVCTVNENNLLTFKGAEVVLPKLNDGCSQLLVADVEMRFYVTAKPSKSYRGFHDIEINSHNALISMQPGPLNVEISQSRVDPRVPLCPGPLACYSISKNGSHAEVEILSPSMVGTRIVVDGPVVKIMTYETYLPQAVGMCLKDKSSRYLGPDQQVLPNAKAFAQSYIIPSNQCPASNRVYHDNLNLSPIQLSTLTSQRDVPVRCDGVLSANGRRFCLHNPQKLSNTEVGAKAVCSSLGGQLPEAETINDLELIKSLVPIRGQGKIWMSATYSKALRKFIWPRGHPVNKILWDRNEPDQSSEDCTAIYRGSRTDKIDRLIDIHCNMNNEQVQILCAIPV